tara:strand:+ start:355 stop:1188 length:834 start_codon:yes stop_codon:yes gene_type:complete
MMVSLPWLGIKYVPLALVLAIFLVWNRRHHDDFTLRLQLFTLLLSGAIYLIVHQRIYGSWTVYATGDHFVNSEWAVVGNSPNYAGRTRRLLGLIVDRRFGIAAWTPAYLLIPLVITRTIRDRQRNWQIVISLCAVGWVVATWVALTMHGWWWSGRQIVPILPLIAILLAVAVDGNRRRMQLLVTTVLMGTFSWLWLVVETSTGRHTLVVDFERTTNPFYRLWRMMLPDHQVMSVGDHLLTAIWTAAVIGGCWWVWTRSKESPLDQSETKTEFFDTPR